MLHFVVGDEEDISPCHSCLSCSNPLIEHSRSNGTPLMVSVFSHNSFLQGEEELGAVKMEGQGNIQKFMGIVNTGASLLLRRGEYEPSIKFCQLGLTPSRFLH